MKVIKAMKLLGVWKVAGKKWTHPYPEMPRGRAACPAVVYKEWLVVTGGWGDNGSALSSVDVLNTKNKQ